jgi:hypothetical protein
MRRKQVRKGPQAGLEMWGCVRWPDCDGLVNIDPPRWGDDPRRRFRPRRLSADRLAEDMPKGVPIKSVLAVG